MPSLKVAKTETVPRLALSYQGAAEAIGIPVKTLRNRISSGKYPELKPRYWGGKPLFLVEELKRFLKGLPTENPAGGRGA